MGSVKLSDFAASEPDKPKEATEWAEPKVAETSPESKTPSSPSENSATLTSTTTSENAPDLSNAPSGESATQTSTVTLSNTAPSVDEITANIMSQIGDIGDTARLKILVYGDPGSTKTSFLATAPNNLIYDLEDGLVAAKQSPNGIADNVKTIPFQSWDQSRALLGTLQKRPEELESYEVFSIDTLSELHKRGLAEVTEREFRKRPSANRYVAETEQHTENNERIVRFFRALRDLDRHLIVVAHARTVEPKNRPAKTYPDFSEGLANKIMAFMDVVIYMEMRKIDGVPTPVGRFISNGQIAAKNRIGLPEEVINPTFEQIMKFWENSKS